MTALDARERAIGYIRRHLRPVPVPHGEKGPVVPGWQTLELTEETVDRYFNGKPQNIGLRLADGLVDVDGDAQEALALFDWLPPTGRVSGRASKRRSHRWFWCHGAQMRQYEDVDGTMLVELRATGQTLVPDSVHPSGEVYVWEQDGSAATVAREVLEPAVAKVAAGALVVRHWPEKGSRHRAALALAGVLERNGWGEAETCEFIAEVARVAGDDEWRERGRNATTTARRLANGGNATGQPSLAALLTDGEKVVEKLRDWLGLQGVGTVTFHMAGDDAGPAQRIAADWPSPPDEAIYHGLLGEIVRAIEPHTEADPVALALTTLAAVGNIVGAGPHWQVSGRRHGLRLFPVLVGPTSKGRKGTAWAAIRPLIELAAPDWLAKCVASGMSSGEGLIWAVRDPIEKTEPLKVDGRVTGYQTVIVDPGVDDKRLFVIEEEFAMTLKVMAREANILSAVIRQAWDDGNLRTLTKQSPTKATGAHITILGHITQDELLRYLDNTEAANGFANRFVWACVRRSKVLPDGGYPGDATLARLASRLASVLEEAASIGLLGRDDAARALWHAVYGPLSEGQAGLLGAVTSRAEAQVMRLAAIYAVLDGSPWIGAPHLEAAVAWWDFLDASARYIFGDALGDPIADAILRALRAGGEMTQTDISSLFGRNVPAGRLDRALVALLTANKVARDARKPEGAGRPAIVWRAV